MGRRGRASRTGGLLAVLSVANLGMIGACSVARPPAASSTGTEEDSGPASSPDGAVDTSVVVVRDAGTSDADAGDADWAPPPPACPSRTFIDETFIAKAAAALAACGSDDGYLRTTTYLRGVQGVFGRYRGDATVACLASVTNGCVGVAACLGFSPFVGGETCGTCMGETAASCRPGGSNWSGLDACDKYAGTCDAGTCTYPTNPLCSGSTQCDANGRPVHCGQGDKPEAPGPECPSFGLACGVNNGTLACNGLGTTCDPPTYSGSTGYFDIDVSSRQGNSCYGDILPGCVNRKRANLDCRCFGAGFSCQSATGPIGDGGTIETSFCGAASECNPHHFTRSCDGSTAVFCNAGKIARIDCNAMGFPGCSIVKPARGCLPDTLALPH